MSQPVHTSSYTNRLGDKPPQSIHGIDNQPLAMQTSSFPLSRIESIDLLRGMVMILMALDHVRDFFHFDSLIFSPTDLQRTTPALFATRLITHVCAPTFIFLAGTSAYFIAQRKTTQETSVFLVTRGLWLIFLQLTLVRFAWNFDPVFHFNSSNIISTIGFCMIVLALLIHVRRKAMVIIGLLLVVGHHLLDGVSFEDGSVWEVVWSFVHVRKLYLLDHHYSFLFLYPIVPWVGVMALGYCLGSLYGQDYSVTTRKRVLVQLGLASLLTFLLVRWLNLYGDPMPWTYQRDYQLTIMSFLNLEKYPPSFLYLCLTLGIALTLLGILEGRNLARWRPIILFGKVALFYYVLHLFVIHALALLAVVLTGFPWQTMIFVGPPSQASSLLKGSYGFSLGETYVLWICLVCLFYLPCGYWYAFKKRNQSKWWVSYV